MEIPEVIRFPDQCGLNSVIDGDWCEIPPEYNIQTCFLSGKFPSSAHRKTEIFDRAKVVHFTGTSKPWQFLDKHPFKDRYWNYRDKTVYKRLISDDFGARVVARRFAPVFVKRFIKSVIPSARGRTL